MFLTAHNWLFCRGGKKSRADDVGLLAFALRFKVPLKVYLIITAVHGTHF